jgi:hypothetical protein
MVTSVFNLQRPRGGADPATPASASRTAQLDRALSKVPAYVVCAGGDREGAAGLTDHIPEAANWWALATRRTMGVSVPASTELTSPAAGRGPRCRPPRAGKFMSATKGGHLRPPIA